MPANDIVMYNGCKTIVVGSAGMVVVGVVHSMTAIEGVCTTYGGLVAQQVGHLTNNQEVMSSSLGWGTAV